MSEDRYVVKCKDSAYYYTRYAGPEMLTNRQRRAYRYDDKLEAIRAARCLSTILGGRWSAVRLRKRNESNRPGEVFVTMSDEGIPRDAFRTSEEAMRQVESHSGGTRYSRVVRYVLAEGK